MKTIQYDNPKVGCYIDESAGSADECNERTIQFAESYGFTYENIGHLSDPNSDWYSETLSEIADDAVDYLNTLETRDGYYWEFYDNSLYLRD